MSETDQPQKTHLLDNFSKVPCFRRSLLSGITGGLGAGVGYFFMTSNVRKSTQVGFGSYLIITMGVWFYCRYNFAQERIKQRQIKKAIQHQLLTEGTDQKPQDV
ncbi:hypothetical protein BaRGS_00004452 [Batillaria attramentaria]|uniref:Cytochrome c oxidase assembly protein COX20, mitochondrial n=1 Tax=Batillaria attramentaria TaxID=370345 RepID=A0ABD0LYE7_9CAEN